MTHQTHREWYKSVTAFREELATDPANLDLASRVWDLLSGSTGFDVRTGRLAIETFRAAALRSDAGLVALVSAFRQLADETGEFPCPELIDPRLENLLRVYLRDATPSQSDQVRWILEYVDEES